MQRGLGGFPHERLHQDGSREQVKGKRQEARGKRNPPLTPPRRGRQEARGKKSYVPH
ncbi:hypothetical protein [Moorena sp. SIO3A2]|uniref:hypothetical protein n=1 Tax=Moorena sp. SIO3A2 TaxID=2607841 RepID=UPI0013B82D6B|nr:hypothetical protein [Moorena sp. SIO3A2]NER88742.1 hypothetical protein [Moorena sp. SIO3A2]